MFHQNLFIRSKSNHKIKVLYLLIVSQIAGIDLLKNKIKEEKKIHQTILKQTQIITFNNK